MANLKKYLLYFLILIYVSGAVGFLIKPSFFSPFTPFTLVFTSLVFLIYQPITTLNYLVSFFAIAIIGFVSEVVGVKTGLVFGNYYYGSALGYQLLSVPLVICLNWALLINMGVLVAAYFSSKAIVVAFLSAVIVTSVDFLMEQVASRLNFWHFSNGLAGIHNYIAWFLIAFFTTFLLQQHLSKGNKKVAAIILLLQLFFFGVIYSFKLFNFT